MPTDRTLPKVFAARCEALFASDLSASTCPDAAEVTNTIHAALSRFGGSRGCAVHLAGEYGDHPEIAAARMRWAITTVQQAFGPAAAAGR